MNITTENAQELLTSHIESMLATYREQQGFTDQQLEDILELADFTDYETSKAINKFYHINCNIAANGGIPILKDIYTELTDQ